MACAIVTPVLGVYLSLRLLQGYWGPRIVPIAALLVALSGPADAGVHRLQTAPIGILAMIGSFLLFVVGTLAALTKAGGPSESSIGDSKLRL